MTNHNLERVDQQFFRDHPHYLNVWDYGAHPRRVMVGCFYCGKYAIITWKDTYARTMNRVWGTMPALITASFAIITAIFILWAIATVKP